MTKRVPGRGRLSRKLAGVGTTIFAEMTRRADAVGAVNLAQGFPDFDGPEFIKAAAIDAIACGDGQYANATGVAALRSAVSAKYERIYGLSYNDRTEVTVGCGATELLFAAVQALCDVGDEVVLFEPFYDAYRASIWMAGATARVVALRAPSWTFDPDELARAFSPRTRVLLLNSPHNPTGKVFSPAELDVLAELCVRHDVICVADEVYEHLVYDGAQHVPMASRPAMAERTLTVSSLSKTFSLTGWRIGWAVGPAPLTDALRTARQFITFAAPTPLQHAAATALTKGDAVVETLRTTLEGQRNRLAAALRAVGFDVYAAAGSYFLCAGFGALAPCDDVTFAHFLTEEVGVAVIPPSAFYEHPPWDTPYVRFVFCKRDETVNAAIVRLAGLPSKLAATTRFTMAV